MSSEYTIVQLAKLTEKFNSAFEKEVQTDSVIMQKIQQAAEDQPEVMAELQNLATTFASKAMMMQFTKSPAEMEEELAPEMVALFEKSSAFASNAIGEEALKGFVPTEDQSEAVSAAFAAVDAPILAKLYAPKI